VLDMECESILIKLDEASLKQKKLSELKLVEGVVLIMSFLDDAGFRIVLYCKDQKDFGAKIKLVSSICDVQEPSAIWEVPFPQCNFELKKTDWRMLGLFFRNSRISVNGIASALGVSTRTVRRRLDFMTEGSVFFPNPILDARKVDGFVYFFLVSYHDKKTKLATDSRLRGEIERIIFLDANAELYTVTAAVCKNISEAGKISSWLGAQDGVKEVFARVVEDIIPVSDWVENEIARRTMI
jgi:DNA-binding Lrp family transcriptional regulator